jgi:pimeloyl-ACP methyl ester carboxylesterase
MEKQASYLEGQLNYSLKGSGKAVVLLHGFLEDHSIWINFSDKLSEKFNVISIDLPGFGKSSVFSTLHSMEFMAKAVKHILDEENVDKFILAGHSMGGYVSLAFAKLYPEKLKGLVLFHSQAAADTEEAKTNRNRTIEIVKSDHASFIHSFVPTLFAEKNVAIFSEEIKNLQKVSAKTPTDGIVASLAGMRDRNDSLKLLAEIDIPVYFIAGKQDSKIALPLVMEQLSLPKNSEAIILDEVGHMGFIEAEETTYFALESFIERTI